MNFNFVDKLCHVNARIPYKTDRIDSLLLGRFLLIGKIFMTSCMTCDIQFVENSKRNNGEYSRTAYEHPRNSIRCVWLNDAAAHRHFHFKEFPVFFGCFSNSMPKVKAFDSTFYELLLNVNNRMLANSAFALSLHIVIETSFAIKPYGMC